MTRSLRVLHVDTGREWRGGQRQVLLLVDQLRRAGHESVCAFRAGAPLARAAAEAGFTLLPFAPRGEWDLAAAWRLRRQVRRNPPDLLHAHDAHAVTFAALAGMRTAPVVASRRVAFRVRRDPFSRLKRARVARWLAVSAAARGGLLRAGVPAERIVLVRSGVPGPRSTRAPGRPLATRADVPAEAFLVLTAGRLEPSKGQRTVLEACALARDLGGARWVVAGEGRDRAFLERLAADLGVLDRLSFTGDVPDLPDHLGEAQVFVLASFAEGMGSAALDALAAGVPVVASRVGGLPEVIGEDGAGFLVTPGDARALAEAVRALYLDPALRRSASEKALQRAERFTPEATARATVSAYLDALEPPGPTSSPAAEPDAAPSSGSAPQPVPVPGTSPRGGTYYGAWSTS